MSQSQKYDLPFVNDFSIHLYKLIRQIIFFPEIQFRLNKMNLNFYAKNSFESDLHTNSKYHNLNFDAKNGLKSSDVKYLIYSILSTLVPKNIFLSKKEKKLSTNSAESDLEL